jgi:hypothetical protein
MGLFERYELIQIVAPHSTFEKSRFQYLAEGIGYITGTAITGSAYCMFLKNELVMYGSFPGHTWYETSAVAILKHVHYCTICIPVQSLDVPDVVKVQVTIRPCGTDDMSD